MPKIKHRAEPSPLTVKGWGQKFNVVISADQPTSPSLWWYFNEIRWRGSSSGIRLDFVGSLLPNDWNELLRSARDAETFEIVPTFPDRRWPASVMLAMRGFSAGFTKLRKACD